MKIDEENIDKIEQEIAKDQQLDEDIEIAIDVEDEEYASEPLSEKPAGTQQTSKEDDHLKEKTRLTNLLENHRKGQEDLEKELTFSRNEIQELRARVLESAQSAIDQRKHSLELKCEYLTKQAKEALENDDKDAYQEIFTEIIKNQIDLNKIDDIKGSRKNNIEKNEQTQTVNNKQNLYDDSPEYVAELESRYLNMYDGLERTQDKEWLDKHSDLFQFTTKESQAKTAAVFRIIEDLSKKVNRDDPSYHKELESVLRRRGYIKTEKSLPYKQDSPVITNKNNIANKSRSSENTINLTREEAQEALKYIDRGWAKSKQEAYKMYAKDKKTLEMGQ